MASLPIIFLNILKRLFSVTGQGGKCSNSLPVCGRGSRAPPSALYQKACCPRRDLTPAKNLLPTPPHMLAVATSVLSHYMQNAACTFCFNINPPKSIKLISNVSWKIKKVENVYLVLICTCKSNSTGKINNLFGGTMY